MMARQTAACPICGNKAIKDAAPFCSQRCQNVDLNRWLNGSYAIPTQEQTQINEPSNDNHNTDES